MGRKAAGSLSHSGRRPNGSPGHTAWRTRPGSSGETHEAILFVKASYWYCNQLLPRVNTRGAENPGYREQLIAGVGTSARLATCQARDGEHGSIGRSVALLTGPASSVWRNCCHE